MFYLLKYISNGVRGHNLRIKGVRLPKKFGNLCSDLSPSLEGGAEVNAAAWISCLFLVKITFPPCTC
jgi:hypothetical protein